MSKKLAFADHCWIHMVGSAMLYIVKPYETTCFQSVLILVRYIYIYIAYLANIPRHLPLGKGRSHL